MFGLIKPVGEDTEELESEREDVIIRPIIVISGSTRASAHDWAYWAALGALPIVVGLL